MCLLFLRARQPIQSLLAGRHASRLRGRGLNFEEIRRYHPGDDVRQIDWKVTARTRKAHSRVYTEERERPNLLVVDQRVTMFFGSQVRMKSVVAAEAAALAAWRAVGVKDRLTFVAGSFFEKVPSGADTILMKSILHNWKDDRCEVILRNCRDALPTSGTLIVIERIMPELATTEPQDRSCAMSDLNMLRGPGGRERTEAEYRRLGVLAGFAFVGTRGIGSFSLVQFRKVGR